jgi:hypothetical protein
MPDPFGPSAPIKGYDQPSVFVSPTPVRIEKTPIVHQVPMPANKIVTVLMKQTMKGSPDGITVNVYEEGETYSMPESLAKVFLSEKWAAKVRAEETKEGEDLKATSGKAEYK